MTEQEIQDVHEAWEADDGCRPPHERVPPYPNIYRQRKDDEAVHAHLHRCLLEMGAWVRPPTARGYCVVKGGGDPMLIVAQSDSLISCMARAIVALKGGTK